MLLLTTVNRINYRVHCSLDLMKQRFVLINGPFPCGVYIFYIFPLSIIAIFHLPEEIKLMCMPTDSVSLACRAWGQTPTACSISTCGPLCVATGWGKFKLLELIDGSARELPGSAATLLAAPEAFSENYLRFS